MPALKLIYLSGRNRVFGCVCSLFLAISIARCGELSGRPSTDFAAAFSASCDPLNVRYAGAE